MFFVLIGVNVKKKTAGAFMLLSSSSSSLFVLLWKSIRVNKMQVKEQQSFMLKDI